MTGNFKNLYRFSSLLAVVAMFLGLMVSGCGDEGSKKGADVKPDDSDKVAKYTVKFEAPAAESKAVDDAVAYKLIANGVSGDVSEIFASEDSSITGAGYWELSKDGKYRVCEWTISEADLAKNLYQGRVDYMNEDGDVIGCAFFGGDGESVLEAGENETIVEGTDFEYMDNTEVAEYLTIKFVDTKDPETEVADLDFGESCGVLATFSYTDDEGYNYTEPATVTVKDDSVGYVTLNDDGTITGGAVDDNVTATLVATFAGVTKEGTIAINAAADFAWCYKDNESLEWVEIDEADPSMSLIIGADSCVAYCAQDFAGYYQVVEAPEGCDVVNADITEANYSVAFDEEDGVWVLTPGENEATGEKLYIKDGDDVWMTVAVDITAGE